MGEEARAERLRFLTQLFSAARRDDCKAFGVQSLDGVERKVRGWACTFHARERATLTRVEHDDRHRRGQLQQLIAQLRKLELFATEVQRVGARVTRVVEEEARLFACRRKRRDLRSGARDGA